MSPPRRLRVLSSPIPAAAGGDLLRGGMSVKSFQPDADARGLNGRVDAKSLRDSLLRDSLLVTRIDGMHSHTCAEAIVEAVAALPGVRETEVDFASGQASIIFDAQKVAAHQLIEAVETAGYRCADAALGSGGGAVE